MADFLTLCGILAMLVGFFGMVTVVSELAEMFFTLILLLGLFSFIGGMIGLGINEFLAG